MGRGLRLTELIVKSIQGEGRYAGLQASFIRLPGCNLHCQWCDTKYRDLAHEEVELSDEWFGSLQHNVVVTGGEPTIHPRFEEIVTQLKSHGKKVHVETNGTALKEGWLTSMRDTVWAISPKLPSSGNSLSFGDFIPVWQKFVHSQSNEVFFKFVISMDIVKDLNGAEEIVSQVYEGNGIKKEVYFQPVDNNLAVYRNMAMSGPDYGRYVLQLHKVVGFE